MLICVIRIWNILRTFGIWYDRLVHFVLIWYIFVLFWYRAPRKIWQPWLAACRRIFGNQVPSFVFFMNPNRRFSFDCEATRSRSQFCIGNKFYKI
jgi:hypothetical protein